MADTLALRRDQALRRQFFVSVPCPTFGCRHGQQRRQRRRRASSCNLSNSARSSDNSVSTDRKQKDTKTGAKLDDAALASYKAAVAQADAVWQQTSRTATTRKPNPYETRDSKEIQKAIKFAKAKGKNKKTTGTSTSEPVAGIWQSEAHEIVGKVSLFLTNVRQKRMCNNEQLEFLEKVCERIQAEAMSGQDRGGAAETNTQPFRWALHGGPGTGKSYALNLLRKELFEERLGWQQGSEFQIVTFQAVNAEPLDGDTIHSALGLAWHGNDSNVNAQRILDLAGNAIRWRWLLIDEISMVSAEMLARLEARCRQLAQDFFLLSMQNRTALQLRHSEASTLSCQAICDSCHRREAPFSVKFLGNFSPAFTRRSYH